MRRRTWAAIAAAVIAVGLTGCGSDDDDSSGDNASGGSGDATETGDIRVWLNGTDTPQEARDYLKTTFEADHPGSTLTIEEQSWDGLVEKLTTSLSGSDSPDVVEVGNTQAPAFTSAGAFADLTDKYDELGGDDLLPGFVAVGSYDGKFYAPPYYSGSRLVFYRKDMYRDAGLSVPSTLDEYIQNGKTLAEQNPGVSGIYFPGQDWYNALPYIWENGGDIATQNDDGTWTAALDSEGSMAGLQQIQDVMQNASEAPKDGNETNPQVPYCEDKIAQLSAPSWVKWSILAPADADVPGCPKQEKNLGVFALPGMDGGPAQVFAGGSNIAISVNSAYPDLAYDAMKIMLSADYQTILGKAGLVPAETSLGDTVGTDEVAQAIVAAATNAKLTPASPQWAEVEAQGVMQDLFVQVAQGGDLSSLAADADGQIESILNG
jgi:N,N'-diacetylchitobiose transport system substrate-binding protein